MVRRDLGRYRSPVPVFSIASLTRETFHYEHIHFRFMFLHFISVKMILGYGGFLYNVPSRHAHPFIPRYLHSLSVSISDSDDIVITDDKDEVISKSSDVLRI